jgi:hypothetical protein
MDHARIWFWRRLVQTQYWVGCKKIFSEEEHGHDGAIDQNTDRDGVGT